MTTFLTTPVDPDNLGVPFYIDLLREHGVDADAFTIDDFLYRDDDLEELCLQIVESPHVDTYLKRSETLLAQYPTNALVLLSIAEAGATDAASLRSALALRELSDVLLTQQRDVPLDTDTQIAICCIGAEVLFRYLLWLDLSDYVLPILLKMVKLVPQSRDHLLVTAFRTAAVCDITHDEDEGGSFYATVRSILSQVFINDPDLMWQIHLSDTVRTFIVDGPEAEGLDSMIANLTATPLTTDQQFSIDQYLDVEPMLKDLFDRFNPPPIMELESDPTKSLRRLIRRQNFASPDEIEEFLDTYRGRPIPEIPLEDLTDDERAEDAVESIMMLPSAEHKERLIALSLMYPTSIWPWVGLISTAQNSKEELILADKGLDIAHTNSLERHSEPYVTLLNARARSLMFEGRYADAIDAFECIISLDRGLVRQAGEPLLALLIRRGQRQHLERAEQIIAQLRKEESQVVPALPWLKLLFDMIHKRDQSIINISLAEAMNTLPHIGLWLTGLMAHQTSYALPAVNATNEEEMLHTITLCRQVWPVYPEAVKELKNALRK